MSATDTSQPIRRASVAPPFGEARVHDAMRMGVLPCPAQASLEEVAGTMAAHRIHCVIVSDVDRRGRQRPWGIVSDLDLAMAAGENGTDRTAGEIARSELVTVSADDSLAHAAQLMGEHETSHLVVAEHRGGQPLGVLSTLDLAGVLARGGRR